MHLYNSPFPRCFLHFFDIHFLNEIGNSENVKQEAILATKLAFLCSDTLIVPAASFFESDICHTTISDVTAAAGENSVLLMSKTKKIELFIELKLLQYSEESPQYAKYTRAFKNKSLHNINSIKKDTSTTSQIKAAWDAKLNDGSLFQEFSSRRKILPDDFEDLCRNMDTALDGRAYTPEYITEILFSKSQYKSLLQPPIDTIINSQYFSSYVQELPLCAVVVDLTYLHSTYVDDHKYSAHLPYKAFATELSRNNILNHIQKSDFKSLYKIKFDDKIITSLQNATNRYYALINHVDIKNTTNTGITNVTNITNNNSGQAVTIVGNNNNVGDITNNPSIDWAAVQREFDLIKTHIDSNNEHVSEIAKAIQERDARAINKAIKAAGLTAQFLFSISASVIANIIGIPPFFQK